jgi:hypothetical protein
MSTEVERNGFTDIALQKVERGEETIEDLEKKAAFLAKRSDETSQKMLEGVEAALEILRA